MKLTNFRIRNYRSIEDSGLIDVTDRTVLVGRNESGKSNLLLALASLNPPTGVKALSDVKDFPRKRRITDFTTATPVVDTTWELTATEQSELIALYPRAQGTTSVSVGRSYSASRSVGFTGLSPLIVQATDVASQFAEVKKSVRASARPLGVDVMTSVDALLETLGTSVNSKTYFPKGWAESTKEAVAAFRRGLEGLSVTPTENAQELLDNWVDQASAIVGEEKAAQDARNWVASKLPKFIYLSDYPELNGHQNISEYLSRKNSGILNEADENFEKLCKVAGLNPAELQQQLSGDHERRQLIANRASAVVTGKIRELWKDRSLKVRFNLDAQHLDTLISDPSAAYDVEVNLDERSRGFQWFFSFYIAFAADTDGGSAADAILLLDEPGLYLHAVAQGDLLAHLKNDFKNQILFTTHSPFMIPVDDLDTVRTVNISQTSGTLVSNDPVGDEKTLFPLQTALGYSTSQSLFIGEKNLVVEGVSDFWYLSAANDYLSEQGQTCLPEGTVITPAGGAQRVTYMVSLLTSHRLRVVVLLDKETAADRTADELLREKLIRKENIVFVTEAFSGSIPTDADIEDVLDPAVYESLVQEHFVKELQGVTLALNDRNPRIAKRYEEAFKAAGLKFSKNGPAKLFLRLAASDPARVMTPITQQNFATVFKRVGEALAKQGTRRDEPFTT